MTLAHTSRNCWEVYNNRKDEKAMDALAARYIDFLSRCKTERETIAYVEERLAKAGFAPDFGADKVMRSLHGKDGITEALEQVRLALAGYAPPAFGKFVPVSDEFLGEHGGEWRYAIDFVTTTTVIEDEEPDLSPRSTRLTFLGENPNEPQVQVPRPD